MSAVDSPPTTAPAVRGRRRTRLARRVGAGLAATLLAAAALAGSAAAATASSTAAEPSVGLDSDVVAVGQPVTLRAGGLGPYDAVAVALDGDDLITLRADDDGTLIAPVPLPASIAEGRHQLTVTAAGLPTAATLPVTVASADVAAALGLLPAVPPDGPGSNTPGTSSTVSPAVVAHGETLSFTLAGYPAGETVYVKIDDGSYQGDGVTQGADIVATFPISGDGTVEGGITVPGDLEIGEHTLRFLATEVIDQGTLGYTHASDPFTVTAASGGESGGESGSDSGGTGGDQSGSGDASGGGDNGAGTGGDEGGTGGTGGGSNDGLAKTGPAGLAAATLAGLAALAAGVAAVRSARTRRLAGHR